MKQKFEVIGLCRICYDCITASQGFCLFNICPGGYRNDTVQSERKSTSELLLPCLLSILQYLVMNLQLRKPLVRKDFLQ